MGHSGGANADATESSGEEEETTDLVSGILHT
jgi:hypothetical protein